MEERLRMLALMLLRRQRVSLDELRKELKMADELLLDLLSGLPVSLEGGEVVVADAADLLLGFWGKGLDPIELALKAGWKDFEKLCSRILERSGFETMTNVRFKASEGVRELDVLALREPWLLAVDCKRWARRRESHLRVAARSQKARCNALAREIARVDALAARVARWREVNLVPVVVSVHETLMKVFEGVPIVPLRKLPSFLDEFEAFVDEIYVVKVALK